jgi:tRNA G18 (ribose-2'-O)-methylase SpoU
MLEPIEDAADPRIAPYRAVGDPVALEREGLFVAEGRLVVERLLEDGRFEIHSVVVSPAAAAALEKILGQRPAVPAYVCEPAVLAQITGFDFHRGCLSLARRPQTGLPLSRLSQATRVLALEGVGNPDNVGGLFRAAFAFGVDGVILDRATADPLYRKAIRTSMAATLRVPFVRVDPWVAGLASLRASGLRVIALTPHPDAVPLDDYAARRDERLVLVGGSEGSGMSRESLELADERVRIPVDSRADSLNVVTAAAIALHALQKKVTATFFRE